MRINLERLMKDIIVFLAIFILSLVEYNGIYFLLSYPMSLVFLLYKEKYYFVGTFAMILSSFIMGKNYPIFALVLGIMATVLIFHLLRNKKNTLNLAITLSSVVFGVFYALLQYFLVHKNPYNIILISLLFGVFGYAFSKVYLKMQFRTEKTITYKEFILLSLITGGVILNSSFILFEKIDLSLIVLCLFVYIITRIHAPTGIVCCLCTSFCYSINGEIVPRVLMLMTLIFLVPTVKKHMKTGAILYWSIIFISSSILKDYSYLLETTIFVLGVLLINPKIFINIQQYIVDPKDYKIREQKEKYTRMVNKNQTIESLIRVVEEKFKTNTKMKRKYSDKVLSNLNFLMNKINQEPDLNERELLLNDFDELELEIIGLNVDRDYKGDYQITIEIRNLEDYKKIIGCLERIIKKRFTLVSGKYNFLTNATKYSFKNTQDYQLDYYVKQRSVDSKCGDNYMCFNVDNKRYFLISDGMGHGKRADDDSKFALMLLKKFIELGMSAIDAIDACNVLVFSKDDTYNTLDLLEYDSYLNEIILYKNGSGNSYVLYKDNVDKLSSENLPLGIVEEIKASKIVIGNNVEKIILTSDGINTNISKVIKENGQRSLKEMVEQIFMSQETIEDDQTIMAISVIKK